MKRENIYLEHLSEIEGTKFTLREVDIIACLVHNRGDKKIASLLLISPRTVETHIRSITQKLGASSRNHIIDLIIKSGKLQFLNQYYFHLLKQNLFHRQLQKISKVINKKSCNCLLFAETLKNTEDFFKQLRSDLKIANINLLDAKESDHLVDKITSNLYIFSKELIDFYKQNTNIVLILDENLDLSNIDNLEYIDFREKEDYYLSTLKLIKKILNYPELDHIISEFNLESQSLITNQTKEELLKTDNLHVPQHILFKERHLNKKSIALLVLFISCLFVLIGGITFYKLIISKEIITLKTVRSDFVIPHKSMLLKRSHLTTQMQEKLNNNDSIQSVALVGVGGAGKTTLARIYASNHQANVIWEINAETKDSLMDSFENLGYALAKTEEDKQELRVILELQDPDKKQIRLGIFIRNLLKEHSNWLLIYDNVETFPDIKDYFPYDSKAWGQGKVIITTRNATIANNSYIGGNQVVFLENLSDLEQFELFTKILNSGSLHNYTTLEQKKLSQFLQDIPPFPLDISTAAYYIKETGITLEEYLNRKKQSFDEFAITQSEIIKEKSNYIKSRYSIITLSLKHLIKESSDFVPLLLLISTVDSQEIPRNLLDLSKNKIIVDNFLHVLGKYALITQGNPDNKSTFSLHRSTQSIILSYLTRLLELAKNPQLTKSIAETLETYSDQVSETGEILIIKQIMPHILSFLEKNLIDELSKAHLKSKLGHIYWAMYLDGTKAANALEESLRIYEKHYTAPHPRIAYTLGELGIANKMLGNREKEKEYLEKSLFQYRKYYPEENHIKIAWLLVNLGSFYRKSDYEKAQTYFNEALATYTSQYGEQDIRTSWVLGNLGRFYRSFGNYKKAKEVIEKTIAIQQDNEAKNQIEYAWLIINLGIVHHNLGEDSKAKELIERGLSIYKKHLGKEHIEISWSQIHLGTVLGALGRQHEAKRLIEKSLEHYTKHYGNDHEETSWALEKLGIAYMNLGDLMSADKIFSQSLALCEKHYGINSAQVAFVLYNMGRLKFLKNELPLAEEYLTKALSILENKQHPKSYKIFESLIELYRKKAIYEGRQRDIQQQDYCSRVKYLTDKFLSLINTNFPKSCPFVKKNTMRTHETLHECERIKN